MVWLLEVMTTIVEGSVGTIGLERRSHCGALLFGTRSLGARGDMISTCRRALGIV